MTKEEAIEYCYLHENEFKAEAYANGDNGQKQFDCLIVCLEDGLIKPEELSFYGMDY